jgi:hypothetical protein
MAFSQRRVFKLLQGYYLLATLLAPQINVVVQELRTKFWIRDAKPRFIKYFKIPRFNSRIKIHVKLS